MNTEVMFSKKSDEWATPQDLFDRLNAIHHFTLDVCATAENAKCEKFFTKEQNGLDQDWIGEVCWMNPPYSDVYSWMKKASREHWYNYVKIVCLVPARTDTKWFHEFVYERESNEWHLNVTVKFLKGRLKFGDSKNSAPFPSMIVTFNP